MPSSRQIRESTDRSAILRGVYEENLRVSGKISDRRPRERAAGERMVTPRERTVTPRFIALLTSLIVFAAALVIQGISISHYEPASLDASETAAVQPVFEESMERLPLFPAMAAGEYDPSVAELYGLRVRTIVIDAGHGGRDPGAVGQLGTSEKDVTLDVAQRLGRRLARYDGIQVLMTRESDERVTNRERVRFANENGADLFVSIHVNWLPEEEVNSVETYYFGMDADARTLRVVEQHNQDSDFSMADFRRMVQDLSQTIKLQESRALASTVQTSLVENLREVNDNVADWGVKSAPYVVLLGVEAPSILAEIACISNREEEERLNSPAYRDQLTSFLEAGIVNYLRQDFIPTELTSGATHDAE